MRERMWICLSLSFLSYCLSAQQPSKSDGSFYEKREARAPQEVRRKLKVLRANIAAHHFKYSVGYTTALEMDLPACGAAPTASLADIQHQHLIARTALQSHHHFTQAGACTASAGAFSWLDYGAVSPVGDQQCDDCWAFATKAALESNYMTQHGGSPAVSAEDIVACVQNVSCSEKPDTLAFGQAENGLAGDDEVPYNPSPSSQACSGKTTYQAITYDNVGATSLQPTDDEIKQALCDHGAVAAGIFASLAFDAYAGGVFQEAPPSSPPLMNHWVTIIGWDDSKHAWRVKNSWGTGWGENGFAWVDYSSADIGYGAQWAVSK